MARITNLAVIGSVLLALLSIYPGVLVDVVFVGILLSPLWLPGLAIGGVVVLVVQARFARKQPVEPDLDLTTDDIGDGKRPVPHRRWMISTPAMLALSFALILTDTPRREAFVLSRP